MNQRNSKSTDLIQWYCMKLFIIVLFLFQPFVSLSVQAQIDSTFKIFQFPPDKIPRIDGNTDDWAMVPKEYIIGNDQLRDDE